jgi:hypothetical protein
MDMLGQADGSFVDNSAHFSVNPGSGWFIAGIGDFNGDGADDIMLRDGSGNTIDWLGKADGSFSDNSGVFSVNPGTDWHVQDNFAHDPFAI